MSVQQLYKLLPSTDALLQSLPNMPTATALAATLTRPLLRQLINDFLDTCRVMIKEGHITTPAELDKVTILEQASQYILHHGQPHFRRVINATGVVIHTNLGRSLLAEPAIQAVTQAAQHYSNLEFNLQSGTRGSRYSHVEELLCQLTGAEAAIVVNNNAAAVLLMLESLCKDREVVVSRGELVEIGGSFRIPEVMAKSGCILKEVGATNRTHANDYLAAMTSNTAAFMKVHTSNFRMQGFVCQLSSAELATLAHEHGIAALEDLGSGSLINLCHGQIAQLAHEPTVTDAIKAGMDVVSFSGDKVLGGPQAGIIVGKKIYIDQLKANQMTRALRIDKMTLAALEATLRLYTDPTVALQKIPTLRMLSMSLEELHKSAKRLCRACQKALLTVEGKESIHFSVRPGASAVGGGAFPGEELPSWLVCVEGVNPETLRAVLLTADIPLVGKIEQQHFCLDPRTLHSDEFRLTAQVLASAISTTIHPAKKHKG